MRVTEVKKCRTSPGMCGQCAKTINVGDPYRWIQARFSAKRIRCMEYACRFRQSDLVSSDKLSRAYGAQEAVEDVIAEWDGESLDDLRDACTDCVSELRDVAQEYRDSAESIRNTISESPTADECDEKADGLEGWADEIEQAAEGLEEFEEHEPCERCTGSGCSEIKQTKEEWTDERKEEINTALGNCPL